MNNNDDNQLIRKRIIYLFVAILIIAAIGISIHIIKYFMLRDRTIQNAILKVAVIQAKAGPIKEEVILPGNVQAWHQATIYARTNGYINKWLTDIGTHVKQDELLALIESPEVDAQLMQAEADLKTAEANNALAQTTAKRWLVLLKTQSVSQQETDEKVADALAKAALVNSAQANRDRLRQLVSFERVTAPFEGIITARNIDIGTLINAGSGGSFPLFSIAQADRLRIYVRLPQNYALDIKPNDAVQLFFSDYPNKMFDAKLLNTAQAIDPVTRTLLTQFEINNFDYQLLPGSYTQVHLLLTPPKGSVRLPVNTLIFRAQGLQVATIDTDHKSILKSIKIGRDFGDEVEVVSGVKEGEKVILNPPDALISGQEVEIVPAKGQKQ